MSTKKLEIKLANLLVTAVSFLLLVTLVGYAYRGSANRDDAGTHLAQSVCHGPY